ncbi:MAG: hypothetical protein U0987_08355 [Afipia sp.]|nr:hypothetical protein [Afipia sp.]
MIFNPVFEQRRIKRNAQVNRKEKSKGGNENARREAGHSMSCQMTKP